MSDGTDTLGLILGITAIVIGVLIITKNVIKTMRNKIINGIIYDRRSGSNEHYYPVIKYEINNESREYQSYHYSIFQKIGKNIKLVYDEKRNRIIGTYGEMYFKATLILLCGIFIVSMIVMYKLSE